MMFDFLNKPTHHLDVKKLNLEDSTEKLSEPKLQDSNLSSEILRESERGLRKEKKQVAKQQSETLKLQKGVKAALDPKVMKILVEMLSDSESMVREDLASKMIKSEQKQIETAVYVRQTATDQVKYLRELFEKVETSNKLVKKGLDSIAKGTVANIIGDIEDRHPGYEVFKKRLMSKEDLLELERVKQLRIRLREGEIASKVGQLKMELTIEDDYATAKAKQIVEKSQFSIDHQKTKEAEKYIENKRIEREQQERKKEEILQISKLKKERRQLAEEELKQKAKSQRHAKLVEKYEAKQLLKKRKREEAESEKQKFESFLKEYRKRKPLYKQKQEEQRRREIEEKRQRFGLLEKRMENYSSLSMEEIEDFQAKYLLLKKEKEEQKRIQLEVMRKEQQYREAEFKDKNFKGKFRYLVLQEMYEKREKAAEKSYRKRALEQKKRSYSVDVKNNFKPRIDEKKQLESQMMTLDSKKKRQKGPVRVSLESGSLSNYNTISYEEEPEPDPRKEGHKNMLLMKQYLREKIERGQVKTPARTLQNLEQLDTYTPKINYLKEQREKRAQRDTQRSSFSHNSLDIQKLLSDKKRKNSGDLSSLKLKVGQIDEKARRKEQVLKYMEHSPNDEKQLQDDYLSSIKAKMLILQNSK